MSYLFVLDYSPCQFFHILWIVIGFADIPRNPKYFAKPPYEETTQSSPPNKCMAIPSEVEMMTPKDSRKKPHKISDENGFLPRHRGALHDHGIGYNKPVN